MKFPFNYDKHIIRRETDTIKDGECKILFKGIIDKSLIAICNKDGELKPCIYNLK